MASGVGFQGSNAIMYGFGEVVDLEVFRVRVDEPNGPQVISCWRLDAEELAEVARTGVVWLSIVAGGMPPVFVSGKALVKVDGEDSIAEPLLPKKPHGDKPIG